MNAMHSLALVITPEHLSCYRREDGRWRPMPLEGALVSTLDERAERQVEAIRDELHDRASIASARLSLLVDDAARARAHAARLCTAALEAGLGRVDTWRLGLLAERAEVPGAPSQAQWCVDHLLPCLDEDGAGGPRHESELTALLETDGGADVEGVDGCMEGHVGIAALLDCVDWANGPSWDGRWALAV